MKLIQIDGRSYAEKKPGAGRGALREVCSQCAFGRVGMFEHCGEAINRSPEVFGGDCSDRDVVYVEVKEAAVNLTPTMRQAVAFARDHGGFLLRSPGGFWHAAPEQKRGIRSQVTFRTKTVEALVARGVGEYTEWVDGRNGRFHVRVVLKDAA